MCQRNQRSLRIQSVYVWCFLSLLNCPSETCWQPWSQHVHFCASNQRAAVRSEIHNHLYRAEIFVLHSTLVPQPQFYASQLKNKPLKIFFAKWYRTHHCTSKHHPDTKCTSRQLGWTACRMHHNHLYQEEDQLLQFAWTPLFSSHLLHFWLIVLTLTPLLTHHSHNYSTMTHLPLLCFYYTYG